MRTYVKRLRIPAISLILAACVLLPAHPTVYAGQPQAARYDANSREIFWFIHASDLHIGARGTTDSSRLQWLVTTAKNVIKPEFIVATGDLTDSTNGNLFGIPNGPYQAEWDQYKSILSNAGMTSSFFYDIPGNHDAYSDATFKYYRLNSVQGLATGGTQVSWTRDFGYGKYHFLGVNSAGNDGRAFSISFPFGDYAGLDDAEIKFIGDELNLHSDARLTLVFGHHPVTDTGQSDDTWLFYGHQDFIRALDTYRASTYNYGHTHDYSQALFKGNAYTGPMYNGGVHYYNVRSLGKDSGNYYSIVAIDSNGLSTVTPASNTWPVALITAPVDKYIGGAVNPYAYTVPARSDNFVRALVFDASTSTQVSYRIDGGTTWYAMTRAAAGSPIWQGAWDASALAPGEHTIQVRAVSTSTVYDSVTVQVTAAENRAPVAVSDSYAAVEDTVLTVAAKGVLQNDTDADGDVLTAVLAGGPSNGTVSLTSDGSFSYSPKAGFTGTDSFTYKASDGKAESSPAPVTIIVSAASTADTVIVTSATWTRKNRNLVVQATSTAQPDATLTVQGYGVMTWNGALYTFTKKMSSAPTSVTVTSTRGGSDSETVTVK
jgi:hypothetical protein